VPNSRYKLLCLDIDGTLVDHRVPLIQEQDLKLIRKASDILQVIVNTGRSWTEAQPIFQQLGFTPQLSVFAGGGLVLDHQGQVLRSIEIDLNMVRQILESLASHRQVSAFICAQGRWRSFDKSEDYRHVHALSLHNLSIEASHELVAKVASAFPQLHVTTVSAGLNTQARSVFISDKEANKGSGLSLIAKTWKITPVEILSIGDMPIDIPMFKASGFGIAMGNASEEVQKAAARVTKSVTEQGVSLALKKYLF